MTDLACELVGGPQDGEVLMIQPGHDGLPLQYVQLAQVDDVADIVLHPELGPTEVTVRTLTYTRTRISEDTHHWIYRLDGMRT